MIGEIAFIPQVEGPARDIVAKAVAEIDAQGLRFQVGALGTSVEGDLDAILDAVRAESRVRAEGVRRGMIEVRVQLEPHEETLEHQVGGIGAAVTWAAANTRWPVARLTQRGGLE